MPLRLYDGAEVDELANGLEVELCYEAEAVQATKSTVRRNPKTGDRDIALGVPVEVQVPKQSPSNCSCKWQARKSSWSPGAWIPWGGSVIFSVPREYLANNLKIYTLFNYEWESSGGRIKDNEPHHFFYSSDLPSNVR